MNNDNLINLKERSKKERIKIAKMGAQASAQKKRDNKTMRDELLYILNSVDDNNLTERFKISVELVKQAKQGNVRAYELISNIVDGKPSYQVNLTQKQIPIIIDDIV